MPSTRLILKDFEYFQPKIISEVISLLAKYREKAKILAGGTDLLIQMKLKTLKPDYVVNIMEIPELQGISFDAKDGLRIGSATTIRTIEKSEIVAKQYPLLIDATKTFGSVQVKNVATIGGNLCNASPGADFVTPLLALGAQAKIVSSKGERIIPLDVFFIGPDKCILEPDELLVELLIPPPPPSTGSAFMKLGRITVDLSKVNAATVLTAKGGVCEAVGIAMGAVAPTPIRAKNAEAALKGQKLSNDIIEEAARLASAESSPRTSLRSTAEYKREAVKVLVKRCLRLALQRGGG